MANTDVLDIGDLALLADGDQIPPTIEEIDQITLPTGTVTAADEGLV